jgi:hypothetical protein
MSRSRGSRGRKDGPVASSTTRAILRAMEATGVRRFVAVSAAPVGPVPEGESLVNRRILLPFIGVLLRDLYADLAEMEDEIRRSTTEWTVVRPPKLVNKPLTGKYRTIVGSNVPRGYAISRADTAHAHARCAGRSGDARAGGRGRVLTFSFPPRPPSGTSRPSSCRRRPSGRARRRPPGPAGDQHRGAQDTKDEIRPARSALCLVPSPTLGTLCRGGT